MKKQQIVVIALMSLALIGIYIFNVRFSKNVKNTNALYTIGILQTASHPALDAVRQGFIDEIKSQAKDAIDFVVYNGQGSIATIHTIAQQLHAKNNINGIFAIATPAAQAIMSVEQEKPIGIAAVTVNAVTKDLFKQQNVYGVSDMIDVAAEIDAMKILLPESKTIGILYSTAELNSVATVELMVKELEKKGLTSLLIGVTSEADIEPALASAVRKIDVLLTPTDNMVANAITFIAKIMENAQKPLIVSDNMLVQYGALMARGVDYYQSGKQAADLSLKIFLHHKKPHEIPIVSTKTQKIYINKNVCERLQIIIPESIKRDIVLV